MKKYLLTICVLFSMNVSTSYATMWTGVYSNGQDVQCNGWGWVSGNYYTVWPNECDPIETKSGNIITGQSSKGVCDDGFIAIYDAQPDGIAFTGCFRNN